MPGGLEACVLAGPHELPQLVGVSVNFPALCAVLTALPADEMSSTCRRRTISAVAELAQS